MKAEQIEMNVNIDSVFMFVVTNSGALKSENDNNY